MVAMDQGLMYFLQGVLGRCRARRGEEVVQRLTWFDCLRVGYRGLEGRGGGSGWGCRYINMMWELPIARSFSGEVTK